MNKIDDAHQTVFNYWNIDQKRFIHPDQIALEKEQAAEDKLEKEGPPKIYTVPDSVIDDWTGTRFAENIKCYGKPCPE